MAEMICPRCQQSNPAGEKNCRNCNALLPKIEVRVKDVKEGNPQRPKSQFRQGQIFATRYTVQSIIGRGGMGCIYKVYDNTLDEEVALKTLLPQFVRDKLVVERFFNEARIARQLSHPNVVRVHDIGSTEGVVYISMEYVRGKSLRAYLENLMPGQRLPLKSVLRVFDELCSALEYAHQFTIHRDIKPENVMITQDGHVKLMDFGISKLMANTQLTQASMVMGTPLYMSPEQLRSSSEVDARADVYSVGIMLYEVLSGNLPVGMAKPISEIRPDLPPALDPIVRKCIEADPAQRFQTAAELREAVRGVRVLVDPDFDPDAGSRLYRTGAGARGPSKLVGWALLAALVVLTAIGLWQAEALRRHRVAEARAAAGAPAAPGAAATPAVLAASQDFVDELRQRGGARADRDPQAGEIVRAGEALWQKAQAAPDPQKPALARQAVQYLVGAALAPQGMVFVPPGDITLRDDTGAHQTLTVDGFFIDATEVTGQNYLRFCSEHGWRRPQYAALDMPEAAIVLVTFYDALAYAAAHGKDLPTEAQWARAAYGAPGASERFPWGDAWDVASDARSDKPGEPANMAYAKDGYAGIAPVGVFPLDRSPYGCYDMAGNVAEWTRTPFYPLNAPPAQPNDPNFGVDMVIRGGHYDSVQAPLSARNKWPFGVASRHIGFRCVKPVPTDPAAIQQLLHQISPD
jgi:formylglycine-generating enzyme required for sulfatase activity/tRNA A-37 threonylcarbamoyl transferase component Bud32